MRGHLVDAVVGLAIRQHGAVSTHQIRRLGVSPKAQRTATSEGWLRSAAPGVLVLAATPDTWLRRLRVGLLALDARGWVSHEAAARWWDVDPSSPDAVEFTIPREARGLRGWGRVHTTSTIGPDDVVTARGFRCSSPARTIIDLAHDGASLARLETALTAMEQRQLTTAAEVATRLGELRGRGRWGATRLDRLLGQRRPPLGPPPGPPARSLRPLRPVA